MYQKKTKKKIVSLLVSLAMVLALSGVAGKNNVSFAAPGDYYVASSNFKTTDSSTWTNWRYQYVTSGGTDYTDMGFYGGNSGPAPYWGNYGWWANDVASTLWEYGFIGKTMTSPGSKFDTVRTFIAPCSGVVTVGSNGLIKGPAGTSTDGVNIKIIKEDATTHSTTQLWPVGSGWKKLTLNQTVDMGSIVTSLNTGDQIRFICNKYYSSAQDAMTWDPKVSYVPIAVDKSSISFGPRDTNVLTAAVDPSIVDKTINWSTSDPNVATVTATSETTASIIAKGVGTATITASLSGYAETATCAVSVVPYQASASFKTSAPNTWGAWRYQYVTSGSNDYTDMDYCDGAKWWKGSANNWTYGNVSSNTVIPAWNPYDTVRTFVVPAAGKITITSNEPLIQVEDQSSVGGDGARVKLMADNVQVWPATGWQSLVYGSPVNFPETQLSVYSGEKLYFIVNKNGSSQGDQVKWDPIINYSADAPQLPDYTISGLQIGDLSGSTISATVDVTNNNSSTLKDATFIIAIYDKTDGGNLLETCEVVSEKLTQHIPKTMTATLTYTGSTQNRVVKVFLWDTIDSDKPLSDTMLPDSEKSLQ